jgi:hypothetical protein
MSLERVSLQGVLPWLVGRLSRRELAAVLTLADRSATSGVLWPVVPAGPDQVDSRHRCGNDGRNERTAG